MAVNFRDLLSRPMDDVKAPSPLPAGTYYGLITKQEFGETPWVNRDTGEKDLQVKFTIRQLEPVGIDPDMFADIELDRRIAVASFQISGDDQSAWRCKQFIESLGITTAGRTWSETVTDVPNNAVMFDITHRMNRDDPTAPPYTDVKNLRKRPE